MTGNCPAVESIIATDTEDQLRHGYYLVSRTSWAGSHCNLPTTSARNQASDAVSEKPPSCSAPDSLRTGSCSSHWDRLQHMRMPRLDGVTAFPNNFSGVFAQNLNGPP